jgi:lauroyl/myristoyl acyltransferase
VLTPIAFARSVSQKPFQRVPQPACLGNGVSAARESTGALLNRTLEFFPDRLADARWSKRCRIDGLEHWRDARRRGHPVILAFGHFGPFRVFREWMRAAGVPASALIAADPETRPKLKRLEDAVHPFPETPTCFCLNQLRAASAFVAAGNTLFVALDHPVGKRLMIPLDAEWSFEMSAGALRLAARHGAELIPCAIVDEGGWRFRIQLGRPVPEKFLANDAELVRAGKHLLDELLPVFRSHPEQCEGKLLERFRPAAAPETALQFSSALSSFEHAPARSTH